MEEEEESVLRRLVLARVLVPDARQRGRAEGLRGRLWHRVRRELGDGASARGPGVGVSSAELVARLRRRDPEAFDLLFQQQGATLLAYASKSLRGPDAEDAVQEAWLDLVRKAERMPEGGELLPWMIGFVRNAVARSLRRSMRFEELGDEPLDERSDEAELAALRSEDEWRLAEALAELNVLEQEVVLRRIEGDATDAIAGALELKPGHVRVLQHRAVRKLAALLGGS